MPGPTASEKSPAGEVVVEKGEHAGQVVSFAVTVASPIPDAKLSPTVPSTKLGSTPLSIVKVPWAVQTGVLVCPRLSM